MGNRLGTQQADVEDPGNNQQSLLTSTNVLDDVNFWRRWWGRSQENGAGAGAGADERNVFIRVTRLWETLIEILRKFFLLLTPAVPAQPEGGDQALPPDNDNVQWRERQYSEGIVPAKTGFHIKIKGPDDLNPIANLMKEKIELEKYLETIFKSGRDSRKDLIITVAGTLLLGILNAIVEGLLADHIPFGIRMTVLGIFCATFVIFFGAAMYEQNLIYEHALADARSSHSTMIRSMNVHRNSLMLKNNFAPTQEDLSDEEGLAAETEEQLQKVLLEYCEKIIQPLPIRRQRTAAFVSMGCVVVVLLFACVLKAMSLNGSPVLAPAPAPYPG